MHQGESTGIAIALTVVLASVAKLTLALLKVLCLRFKNSNLLKMWMDQVDTVPVVRYCSEV